MTINFVTGETTVNSYTNNELTQNCIETWGKRLEALSWNEKLCLLNAVIGALGDPNEELSNAACEAASQIIKVGDLEGIVLVRALCDLMGDSVCDPLTSYTDNDWAINAAETWGERLGDLSLNDHSWILWTLTNSLLSGENLIHEDEIANCSEWLENGGLTDQEELHATARAIAELIQEQYENEPLPWEPRYEGAPSIPLDEYK